MTTPESDRTGVRLFPPLVLAVALAAAYLMQRLFPLSIGNPGSARLVRVVGALLIVAALVLAFWAVATFRRAGTTANPAGGSTALAFAGPYRITRNPMYLGLTLMLAGIGLAANLPWALILLPPFVLLLRSAVIVPEERYLEAKFGEPYRAYKTRVRRWI